MSGYHEIADWCEKDDGGDGFRNWLAEGLKALEQFLDDHRRFEEFLRDRDG